MPFLAGERRYVGFAGCMKNIKKQQMNIDMDV